MNLVTPIACPDCAGKLGQGATKCRCGWRLTVDGLVPSARQIACDMVNMCDGPAKISVMVEGKRLNACMKCYHAHRDAELAAYNSKKSVEERQANRERAEKILRMGRAR
jgi:hypothetical protein